MTVHSRTARGRSADRPQVRCELSDVAAAGTRALTLGDGGSPVDIFLVHRAGRVHGYRNRRPRTGAMLHWKPGAFLDADGTFQPPDCPGETPSDRDRLSRRYWRIGGKSGRNSLQYGIF